jgi:hypothetical protein
MSLIRRFVSVRSSSRHISAGCLLVCHFEGSCSMPDSSCRIFCGQSGNGTGFLRVCQFPSANCRSANFLFFLLSSEFGAMGQLASKVPRDSVSFHGKKVLSTQLSLSHAERMKKLPFQCIRIEGLLMEVAPQKICHLTWRTCR